MFRRLHDYRYIFVWCITVVTAILPQCSFIDFSTLDGATSAVKLRDVYLHGKKLTIRFASSTTKSGNGSSSEWSVEMHVCVCDRERWRVHVCVLGEVTAFPAAVLPVGCVLLYRMKFRKV